MIKIFLIIRVLIAYLFDYVIVRSCYRNRILYYTFYYYYLQILAKIKNKNKSYVELFWCFPPHNAHIRTLHYVYTLFYFTQRHNNVILQKAYFHLKIIVLEKIIQKSVSKVFLAFMSSTKPQKPSTFLFSSLF